MRKIYAYCFVLLLAFWPAFSSAQEFSAEPVSLEEALSLAPDQGKKILVDVYATWCPYCKRMHEEVYPSEDVQKAISDHFIWVKIDVESTEMVNYFGEEMTQAQFASALENQNVPTVYFLNDEGAIIGAQPGFLKKDVFANLLMFVGSDSYLNQSFEEYTDGE